MTIWILTSEWNDYDQHGEYYIKAYKNKPDFNQLSKDLELDPEFNTQTINSVLSGGGRMGSEYVWYYLREESV